MIQPTAMLIAEDHTGWDAVTKPPAQGGLGFDATWYAGFYHSLIGDSDMAGDGRACSNERASGQRGRSAWTHSPGRSIASRYKQVVYHESHDEAGNAGGTARTIAVGGQRRALLRADPRAAEARCRVCFGLSLLSAGTPMFFMGEEIGAQNAYKYDNILQSREDILGERPAAAKAMFRFYQELITLRRRLRSIRSQNIDVLHHRTQPGGRVQPVEGRQEVIIVASLNNRPFSTATSSRRMPLAIPSGAWKETFNSDAAIYGGSNIGNFGATIWSSHHRLNAVVPANGFVVLVKQ